MKKKMPSGQGGILLFYAAQYASFSCGRAETGRCRFSADNLLPAVAAGQRPVDAGSPPIICFLRLLQG
jgi:hypothetical protein